MAWTWNWVATVGRRYEAEFGGAGTLERKSGHRKTQRPIWGFLLELDLGPKSTKSVLITAVQPSTLQRVEGHTDSWHRQWSWGWEAQGRAPQGWGMKQG